MNLNVCDFQESDKSDWFELWDMADPWCKENNRRDIPESNWRDIVSGNGPLFGKALKAEERLVGYVLYFFCPCIRDVKDECELRDIFIHPDYRRQGGGRKLVEAVFDAARVHYAGRVFWACNAKREDALAFWSRFGSESRAEQVFYNWLEAEDAKVA